MRTIRVQKQDGSWLPLKCMATEANGESATLKVPDFHGTWLIHKTGMIANVGGNDWRIYTLHPEDCAALCKAEGGKE